VSALLSSSRKQSHGVRGGKREPRGEKLDSKAAAEEPRGAHPPPWAAWGGSHRGKYRHTAPRTLPRYRGGLASLEGRQLQNQIRGDGVFIYSFVFLMLIRLSVFIFLCFLFTILKNNTCVILSLIIYIVVSNNNLNFFCICLFHFNLVIFGQKIKCDYMMSFSHWHTWTSIDLPVMLISAMSFMNGWEWWQRYIHVTQDGCRVA